MQFKVPQNVQMEDKIVGPLTLKQMIIIGAGGGVAYVIYIVLARLYFWEVWIWPVAIVVLITALFAFVKLYNVSFTRFMFLYLQFVLIPRQRIWIKRSGDVITEEIIVKQSTEAQDKAQIKKEKSQETMKKLKDISKMLDTYSKDK